MFCAIPIDSRGVSKKYLRVLARYSLCDLKRWGWLDQWQVVSDEFSEASTSQWHMMMSLTRHRLTCYNVLLHVSAWSRLIRYFMAQKKSQRLLPFLFVLNGLSMLYGFYMEHVKSFLCRFSTPSLFSRLLYLWELHSLSLAFHGFWLLFICLWCRTYWAIECCFLIPCILILGLLLSFYLPIFQKKLNWKLNQFDVKSTVKFV